MENGKGKFESFGNAVKVFDNAMKICVFSVMQWGESSLQQKKLRELMFV